MKQPRLGLMALVMCFAGCANLRSVSMTHIPRDRGEVVTATSSDWAFLNLHSSNDFIDEVRKGLLAKCPAGTITGIFTKYETVVYVVMVKRIVTATGFCSHGAPGSPQALDTTTSPASPVAPDNSVDPAAPAP